MCPNSHERHGFGSGFVSLLIFILLKKKKRERQRDREEKEIQGSKMERLIERDYKLVEKL